MTIAMPRCAWCDRPFELSERRHGSKRRFCSSQCRHAFHAAVRSWGLAQVEAGRVTTAELKAMMGRWEKSVRASNTEPMPACSPVPNRVPESAHASSEAH